MAVNSNHDGHRKRLKQRYLDEGLDNFADHQVLELLLFYAIAQKDTNEIAHGLVNTFGSLTNVLNARVEDLKKVPGVGDHAALLLSLVTEICRFYLVDSTQCGAVLTDLDACAAYLVPRFFARSKETVFVLCLDAKCKVLACREVGEGSVNAANISVREVVQLALSCNATTVVLAHNHPSGIALPSQEDIATTRRLFAALQAVEVHLADHIVVADGDYVSLVQSGCGIDKGEYYG